MSVPEDLIAAAREARANAHAPYSGYAVGAALRTANGHVHKGCNVENASFPEGCCAETAAIAAMVSAGESDIAEIAILGPDGRETLPCGGCRQRLAEFGSADLAVHTRDATGAWRTMTLGELLPHAFSLGRAAR
jgi:cytidine deaminase